MPLILYVNFELAVLFRRLVQRDFTPNFGLGQIGRDMNGLNGVIRNTLKPYGLPNARGRRIPASRRFFFPRLFSPKLVASKGVLDAKNQFLFAVCAQKRRDIRSKWGVSAVMASGVAAVHKQIAVPIDRAKDQVRPLVKTIRQAEGFSIPDDVVGFRLANAR